MDDQEVTPRIGQMVLYKARPDDDSNLRHNYADTLPAVVVLVWSATAVNLKVLTDGPVDVWKTSVLRGSEPGQWTDLG